MADHLTEKQLAKRWGMSEGSLANNRRAGKYEGLYFRPGGTRSNVIYILDKIEKFEDKGGSK